MRIDLQTLWIWIRRVNATGGPKSVGLRAKFLACRTQNDCRVNGALMSAPEENIYRLLYINYICFKIYPTVDLYFRLF
jgi:hypothetical protein